MVRRERQQVTSPSRAPCGPSIHSHTQGRPPTQSRDCCDCCHAPTPRADERNQEMSMTEDPLWCDDSTQLKGRPPTQSRGCVGTWHTPTTVERRQEVTTTAHPLPVRTGRPRQVANGLLDTQPPSCLMLAFSPNNPHSLLIRLSIYLAVYQ